MLFQAPTSIIKLTLVASNNIISWENLQIIRTYYVLKEEKSTENE